MSLAKEVSAARRIYSRLEQDTEIHRREQAYQAMPTIQLVCGILTRLASHADLEKFWAGLTVRERKEARDAYEQLAFAASALLPDDPTPFEIVSHAGTKVLLVSTASYAAGASARVIVALPRTVDAETLTNVIVQALRALVASAPLLDQLPPAAGPDNATVELLRRGLAQMACFL